MTTAHKSLIGNAAVRPVAEAFVSVIMPNIADMGKTLPFEQPPKSSPSAALDPSGIDGLRARMLIYDDCGPCVTLSQKTTVSHVQVDPAKNLRPDRMRLLNDIRRIRHSIGPVSTNVAEMLRELRENGE